MTETEGSNDFSNFVAYSISQGISLDGRRSIIDYPIVLAEQQGDNVIIRSSTQDVSSNYIRSEDVGIGKRFFSGKEGERQTPLPFGTMGTHSEGNEIQGVNFLLIPRFSDEWSKDLFKQYSRDEDEQERQKLISDFIRMGACSIDTEKIVLQDALMMKEYVQIFPRESILVAAGLNNIKGNITNLFEYKHHTIGKRSFFEASIGRIERIDQTEQKNLLLIAGVSYPLLDANTIHTSLVDLANNHATEEEMREVIDPYIRLIEV